MSKQWEVRRTDLRPEPLLGGKLYNEQKFQDLNNLLDYVVTHLPSSEELKTAIRSIVEEVTNIIHFNKSWIAHPLYVRSELNTTTQLIKIHIKYFGDEYFDPAANNTTTVVGSVNVFERYERNHSIESGFSNIRITIKLPQV